MADLPIFLPIRAGSRGRREALLRPQGSSAGRSEGEGWEVGVSAVRR